MTHKVRIQKNWLQLALNLPMETLEQMINNKALEKGPMHEDYLCEEELDWCKERNITVTCKMVPPDLKYCVFEFDNAPDALLFRLVWG